MFIQPALDGSPALPTALQPFYPGLSQSVHVCKARQKKNPTLENMDESMRKLRLRCKVSQTHSRGAQQSDPNSLTTSYFGGIQRSGQSNTKCQRGSCHHTGTWVPTPDTMATGGTAFWLASLAKPSGAGACQHLPTVHK